MKIMRREKYKFDYIYDWTSDYELKMRKEYTIKTDVESHNKDFKKKHITKKTIDDNDNKNTIKIYSNNVDNNNEQNEDNNKEETVCFTGCIM